MSEGGEMEMGSVRRLNAQGRAVRLVAGVMAVLALAAVAWCTPALAAPEVFKESASGVTRTGAVLEATINPGRTPAHYFFEYGPTETYGTTVPVPAGEISEEGEQTVKAPTETLAESTTYHFRVVVVSEHRGSIEEAKGPDETFTTRPLPPGVAGVTATALTPTTASLAAQVEPNGLDTTYQFEYGTSPSYGASVPVPAGDLGAGEGTISVEQSLSGLLPDTLYHYRLVAKNGLGTTKTADGTFATFSPTIGGLPDERAYEQVSEARKNGNGAGIEEGVTEPEAGFAAVSPAGERSAAGDRIVYEQAGPSGETASGTDFYSVAVRTADGWRSHAAIPPGYGVNAADFVSELPHDLIASESISRFLFQATGSFQRENPSEVNGQPVESAGLYRAGEGNLSEAEWWLSEPAEWRSSDHHPSFPLLPEPGDITNTHQVPVGGSPELQTAYFTWEGTLVPEDASRAAHVSSINGSPQGPPGFYEWHEGTLRSAGTLPPESPHPGQPDPYGAVPAATPLAANAGNVTPGPASDNEVSADGTKAFFVSPAPAYASKDGHPTELYVREQHESEGSPATTVLVSRNALNGGKEAEGSGGEEAVVPLGGVEGLSESYVYASPDGSRAFFESRDKLAKSAGQEEPTGAGPWTYEFNLDTESLTWLPGVVGPILASSEDGSSFIFENTATEAVELWAGPPAPARVAGYSAPSTGPLQFGMPRAAKDGRVFAFTTNAVMAGANVLNAEGGEPANDLAGREQVYRYDTETGKLLCVSCAPTGGAQTPISGTGRESAARVLADEGARVFFTTAAKLVPRDVNGVENVYEWEQAGTGSCQPTAGVAGCVYLISSGTSPESSFYLGNSESGEDLFFTTQQGLIATDTDESYDVYDARVHGGFPRETRPPECGNGCQGQPGSFSLAGPLTASAGPSGNLAPPTETKKPATKPKAKKLTRAQKLAKALAACRKDRRKSDRRACEKRAKRAYAGKLARKAGRRI